VDQAQSNMLQKNPHFFMASSSRKLDRISSDDISFYEKIDQPL
jgi:hypothetical protein